MMVSRRKVVLADWYSRAVFGVIAVALAMLAIQGARVVEPVAHAQQDMQCGGSENQPCYVKFPAVFLDEISELDGMGQSRGLRVYVTNNPAYNQ